MSKGKQGQSAPSFTWAKAFRDVVVKAMEKGQLIPVLVGLIILLSISKMDSHHISKIWEKVLDSLLNGNIFLWLFIFLLLLIWRNNTKKLRKLFSNEVERLGKEKSELQQRRTSIKLQSSDEVGK
jgi:uncharacterized protein YacL